MGILLGVVWLLQDLLELLNAIGGVYLAECCDSGVVMLLLVGIDALVY